LHDYFDHTEHFNLKQEKNKNQQAANDEFEESISPKSSLHKLFFWVKRTQ